MVKATSRSNETAAGRATNRWTEFKVTDAERRLTAFAVAPQGEQFGSFGPIRVRLPDFHVVDVSSSSDSATFSRLCCYWPCLPCRPRPNSVP